MIKFAGSNPPIYLLHGLFGMARNFETIAKRLSEATKRIVVCLDMPNHGATGRRTSNPISFTETVALTGFPKDEPFDLIAHSLVNDTSIIWSREDKWP